VAIKYTNTFYCKPSKICPKWDFWFENMPHLATLVHARLLKKLCGLLNNLVCKV
jgi:hypothetical protein